MTLSITPQTCSAATSLAHVERMSVVGNTLTKPLRFHVNIVQSVQYECPPYCNREHDQIVRMRIPACEYIIPTWFDRYRYALTGTGTRCDTSKLR